MDAADDAGSAVWHGPIADGRDRRHTEYAAWYLTAARRTRGREEAEVGSKWMSFLPYDIDENR